MRRNRAADAADPAAVFQNSFMRSHVRQNPLRIVGTALNEVGQTMPSRVGSADNVLGEPTADDDSENVIELAPCRPIAEGRIGDERRQQRTPPAPKQRIYDTFLRGVMKIGGTYPQPRCQAHVERTPWTFAASTVRRDVIDDVLFNGRGYGNAGTRRCLPVRRELQLIAMAPSSPHSKSRPVVAIARPLNTCRLTSHA
jgi:hypothetical protein